MTQSVFDVYSRPVDANNQMPVLPNLPWPGQREMLSTIRTVSSIPKGGTDGRWLFPSQQMFYNALMRKKKGADVTEVDMASLVMVHNGAHACHLSCLRAETLSNVLQT